MKKSKQTTAGELRAELEADPIFVARKKLRDQEEAELAASLRSEQESLLHELSEVGWHVNSVWDLVNTSKAYPEAIPVLLHHLAYPYSARTREGIARALAVREARYAWPILANAYRAEPNGRRTAKDGLAVALSATVTPETLLEFINIVKDRSNGESRVLLLRPLRKLKSDVARSVIEELSSDPELAKEIASWKSRKR